MNSVGFIRADGHARVHIGDIHNHLDSSHYPFTAHRLFQHWHNQNSALLWVSADPGCGKSVLAKYLVDDVLPSSTTGITCYFFFKDDLDNQKVLEGALCCILHQFFTQNPILLSDEILEDFSAGDQLFASFSRLRDILIEATRNYSHGGIICSLDALDQCVDQKLHVQALTKHYSNDKGIGTLKFLRVFQDPKESQPTIHLSGESEEEVDKIAQEITIFIKQRIEELRKRLNLTIEEKRIVHDELTTIGHRTYIWDQLFFAVIKEAVFFTKDYLRIIIRNLPRTVEEAYDNILRKSYGPDKARKILRIISHRYHEDLERDLPSTHRLHIVLREACGLFVVIQDSQVLLLYQTTREFLVQLQPKLYGVRSPSLEWQHSLNPEESHRLLTEICISYLLLGDFKRSVEAIRPRGSDSKHSFAFLDYALALQLCDTNSPACLYWLKVYGEKRMQDPKFLCELPTSLLIASYFCLDNLVNLILQQNKKGLDTLGASNQRSVLSWASEKRYDSIVKSLLDRVPKHKVILRDRLSSLSPIINRADKFGRSLLSYSAVNGHQIIV
ncbi:hypothetical protein F4859DRAFT_504783 [Xylaria cf. heliscus]|nr:hypothetical protein F4859DRAFT_504783 [Xylaria cf. heliscus]